MNPQRTKQLERELDVKNDTLLFMINERNVLRKHERYQQSRIAALRLMMRLGWRLE